jgi:SlyX protein
MSDDTSSRLEKIEAHAAHLEHQLEQLNEVVIEQGKTIERFKKQLQRQAATLESIELERIKSTNPKPPHSQV